MQNKEKFYSPETNLILYTLLLIATPFLIVQNYLQQMIGMTSQLSFTLLGIEMPYIVAIAIIFIITLAVVLWQKIKISHIYVWLFVIFMMILGRSEEHTSELQ